MRKNQKTYRNPIKLEPLFKIQKINISTLLPKKVMLIKMSVLNNETYQYVATN